MHATSPNLVQWTKDSAKPVLLAPPDLYEAGDWRDPFVFWNEEAEENSMLLAARLRGGPSRRRGCVALASSTDLVDWTVREPFWAVWSVAGSTRERHIRRPRPLRRQDSLGRRSPVRLRVESDSRRGQ